MEPSKGRGYFQSIDIKGISINFCKKLNHLIRAPIPTVGGCRVKIKGPTMSVDSPAQQFDRLHIKDPGLDPATVFKGRIPAEDPPLIVPDKPPVIWDPGPLDYVSSNSFMTMEKRISLESQVPDKNLRLAVDYLIREAIPGSTFFVAHLLTDDARFIRTMRHRALEVSVERSISNREGLQRAVDKVYFEREFYKMIDQRCQYFTRRESSSRDDTMIFTNLRNTAIDQENMEFRMKRSEKSREKIQAYGKDGEKFSLDFKSAVEHVFAASETAIEVLPYKPR